MKHIPTIEYFPFHRTSAYEWSVPSEPRRQWSLPMLGTDAVSIQTSQLFIGNIRITTEGIGVANTMKLQGSWPIFW